jgi:ribosome-binding protein aMBF1 (putative translation factor)
MDADRKKQLEKAGWRVGNASDFLDLTREEAEFVELKLGLAEGLREEREAQGLTQAEVARRVGSSQSRVAKMESADASVSVDLLIRSLLKLGAKRGDVARLVKRRERRSQTTK